VPELQTIPSRRERKKQATREALFAAALTLTEERGLAAVTVEAITERADVATRTFFNYYPSKVDAVLGRDPERPSRLEQAIVNRPEAEPPLEAIRCALLDDFLPRGTTVDQLLRRIRVVRAEPSLLATMAAQFEEMERSMIIAVATRTGLAADTDVYPSLVVAAAVGAWRIALMRWCDDGGRAPVECVVDDAFAQLAEGLPPPRRRTPARRRARAS
jgi:AcrR family transcriptional regulator